MTNIYEIGPNGLTPVAAEVLRLLTFAGGEPHVNVHDPAAIAGRRFVIEANIGSFNTLGEALVVNDALRRSGAASVVFFCPYLPGARQDRGTPLTARVYADIINGAKFDRVVCVDPHSPVMPALLDRVVIIDAADAIEPSMLSGDNVVLICPDAGATKRTESVAERFGCAVAYARKHRNLQTGALSGFACDPIPDGAVAVVVDDICDGGGTFLGLAAATGLPRERLRLWTTHGIYSKGLEALRAHYSFIGCTDAFPSKHRPDLCRPLLKLATPYLTGIAQ